MSTDKETRYSAPWAGQDGRQWREVSYWVGNGWRRFLQVQEPDGEWRGW
jgi:hypothetical protein